MMKNYVEMSNGHTIVRVSFDCEIFEDFTKRIKEATLAYGYNEKLWNEYFSEESAKK